MVPGAQLPSQGSLDSTQGQALSVNGARETANNFLLDGVDNQDLVINQYSVLPMTDAIEQFKVQSSTYSAEFGRSGGAQINVVLKSGSNQYHGEGFEFVRNRHLDAKNFFDLPNCTSASVAGSCGDIPRLDRSQLGGTFGGPINIILQLGDQKEMNIILSIGEVSQSVSVEADVAQVDTTLATVAGLVDQAQMRDLPLNGRNFEQLIMLAPGVQRFQAAIHRTDP